MAAYFARRLLLILPTFVGVTVLGFGVTRLLPGGPIERQIMQMQSAMAGAGTGSTMFEAGMIEKDQREELIKTYHLDKPWYQAYFIWLSDVATLDLGRSYETHEPVWQRIKERFPISITFGLTGWILAYLVCIPLGIAKALRHGSFFDFGSSAIVFLGYSVPGWAIGLLLLLFFASGQYWDVFPLGGMESDRFESLPSIVQSMEVREAVVNEYDELIRDEMSLLSRFLDRLYYMLLPIFCYMMGSFASLTILTKNSLLENLGQDYVRTAFAKGLSPRRVIFMHTLRNSLIPLATGLGHALSIIMAGSFLIEQVFNIPGIGLLGYEAIVSYDFTVVLGVLAISTLLLLLGNIFSDVLYAIIDPRIRFE